MRSLYAARRERFARALEARLSGQLDAIPSEAGMQLCAILTAGADDALVSRLAAREGVVARAIGQHYLGRPRRPGLLLGFAGVDDEQTDTGLDVLVRAVEAAGARASADDPAAGAVRGLGSTHQACPVEEAVIDEEAKVISTPAYMLGPGPKGVGAGIEQAISKLASWLGA